MEVLPPGVGRDWQWTSEFLLFACQPYQNRRQNNHFLAGQSTQSSGNLPGSGARCEVECRNEKLSVVHPSLLQGTVQVRDAAQV